MFGTTLFAASDWINAVGLGVGILGAIAVAWLIYSIWTGVIVNSWTRLRRQWRRQGPTRFIVLAVLFVVLPVVLYFTYGLLLRNIGWCVRFASIALLPPVLLGWGTYKARRDYKPAVLASGIIGAISILIWRFSGAEGDWGRWALMLIVTAALVVLPAAVVVRGYARRWSIRRRIFSGVGTFAGLAILGLLGTVLVNRWAGDGNQTEQTNATTGGADDTDPEKKPLGGVGSGVKYTPNGKPAVDLGSREKIPTDEREKIKLARDLCARAFALTVTIESYQKALWKAEEAGVLKSKWDMDGWTEGNFVQYPAYNQWCLTYRKTAIEPSSRDLADYKGMVEKVASLADTQQSTPDDYATILKVIDSVGGEKCMRLGYRGGELTSTITPTPGSTRLEVMADHLAGLYGEVKKLPNFKE